MKRKKTQSSLLKGVKQFRTSICPFKLGTIYLDSMKNAHLLDTMAIKEGLSNRDPATFTLSTFDEALTAIRKSSSPNRQAYIEISQLQALGKKFPFKGEDLNCKDNAIKSFFKAEGLCAETNSRLRHLPLGHNMSDTVDQVRALIERVLGHTVPSDIMRGDLRFGPGSHFGVESLKRTFEETTLFYKLLDPFSVTKDAEPFLAAFISDNEAYCEMLRVKYNRAPFSSISDEIDTIRSHLMTSDYGVNRITFVPKDSDKHRTIAVEQSGHIPLQMILGQFIRKRLKRWGVDLDTQSKNRALARLAKVAGLSTIDLSMASDTVAYELVKLLLPREWFVLFNCFRAEIGVCKDKDFNFSCRYEKFSSMGNGFTFELESLIFWAIAKTICNKHSPDYSSREYVTVFGDDIIVPRTSYHPLCEALSFFGFVPNMDKSFHDGSFFESCGEDYLDSTPVRPFFLRREISTVSDINFLFNSIMLRSIKNKNSSLSVLLPHLLSELPFQLRLFGPLHFSFTKELYGYDTTDDMEACLRIPEGLVPKSYAGIRYNYSLAASRYVRLHRETMYAKKEEQDPCYIKHITRYLTFLRGNIEGRIPLRGKTRLTVKNSISSNWDGQLTKAELSTVYNVLHGVSLRRVKHCHSL